MQDKVYYTYIVASRTHVLYIGVTSNLERRMHEHRAGEGTGFTTRYGCDRLVWFEGFADPTVAITNKKTRRLDASTEARSYQAGQPDVGRSEHEVGRGDQGTVA